MSLKQPVSADLCYLLFLLEVLEVQQHQAHLWVLSCLLLPVGQGLPEGLLVPVNRFNLYRIILSFCVALINSFV